MINLKTGEVVLESLAYTLGSNLKRQHFEATLPKENIRRTWDVGTGYFWYYIYGDVYDGKDILLSLCFAPDNKLCMIDLSPQYTPTDPPMTWDDWSEELMKKDKKICDQWLKTYCHLRKPADFQWGSIGSYYDNKGGFVHIMIRYDTDQLKAWKRH